MQGWSGGDVVGASVRIPSGLVKSWGLTRRQIEVLACLCEGLANKEIAERLSIALATVVSHVGAILARSNSDSRMVVVAKVLAASVPAPAALSEERSA